MDTLVVPTQTREQPETREPQEDFTWLGTEENARTILEWVSVAGLRTPSPKGWKLLGMGSYREAYLGPDNVVYKIGTYGAGRACNWQEHQHFAMMRRHPEYAPHASACRVIPITYEGKVMPVSVMEFLDNLTQDLPYDGGAIMKEISGHFNVADLVGRNLGIDQSGPIKIRDFGSTLTSWGTEVDPHIGCALCNSRHHEPRYGLNDTWHSVCIHEVCKNHRDQLSTSGYPQ